jgi:hypothetical protein
MVGRQIALGPGQESEQMALLSRLGVRTDAELADAIRAGDLDDRADEVSAAVRASVASKLAVAHPGYGA